jgi:tetratricopeptide (TPR) repeat protein
MKMQVDLKKSLLWSGTLVFVAMLLLPAAISAQHTQNADSLTYALYQQQQWDELVVAGTAAIRSGVDHYYMQMRVGIAWYEKQNYRRAIPFFRQARQLNPIDEVATEYLYYSYLLSGRTTDARIVLSQLTPAHRQKLGVEMPPVIDQIYIEAGPGYSGISDLKQQNKNRQQTDTIYNQAWYYHDLQYYHAGVNINVLPQLQTYQGVSLIAADAIQTVNYQRQPEADFQPQAIQQEYYGNVQYTFFPGWRLTPAWHLTRTNYDTRQFRYDDSEGLLSDTLSMTRHDNLFWLGISKEIWLFSTELNGALASFDGSDAWQAGFFVNVYPLGNLKLYTRTGLIALRDGQEADHVIFHQSVGTRVLPKLWLDVSATIGNLRGYTEQNAFVLFNIPEDTRFKAEALLTWAAGKHLELSLRYRLMQRTSSYFTYINYEDFIVLKTDYYFNTFIGGIQWNF